MKKLPDLRKFSHTEKCKKCGAELEVLIGLSCPKCKGGSPVWRVESFKRKRKAYPKQRRRSFSQYDVSGQDNPVRISSTTVTLNL